MVKQLELKKEMNIEKQIPAPKVEDKEAYDKYVQKKSYWENLMFNHGLSIYRQIDQMLLMDAFFRAINSSRIWLQNSAGFISSVNEMLGHFHLVGYAHTQLLFIRRLIDPANSDEDRQPVSVKRLLQEVKCNLRLITRENFIVSAGLPYDYKKAIEQDENDWKSHDYSNGPHVTDSGACRSKGYHEMFDRLSGVAPENRDKFDRISMKLIEHFEKMLAIKELEEIKKYVNQTIAHAAEQKSRATKATTYSPTLNQISSCQEQIYQVSKSLNHMLFPGSFFLYPDFVPDYMEGLVQPEVPDELITILRNEWEERAKQINNLEAITLEDL